MIFEGRNSKSKMQSRTINSTSILLESASQRPRISRRSVFWNDRPVSGHLKRTWSYMYILLKANKSLTVYAWEVKIIFLCWSHKSHLENNWLGFFNLWVQERKLRLEYAKCKFMRRYLRTRGLVSPKVWRPRPLALLLQWDWTLCISAVNEN